eukprot:sb/3470183/
MYVQNGFCRLSQNHVFRDIPFLLEGEKGRERVRERGRERGKESVSRRDRERNKERESYLNAGCTQVAIVVCLTGHHCRVLYLAMSPDGQSIVTGAGDETLRFWNVFNKSRLQKESRSALNLFSSILREGRKGLFRNQIQTVCIVLCVAMSFACYRFVFSLNLSVYTYVNVCVKFNILCVIVKCQFYMYVLASWTGQGRRRDVEIERLRYR